MRNLNDHQEETDLSDVLADEEERITALRSTVDHEGAATNFALRLTSGQSLNIQIPFRDMSGIFAEINHAATLMLNRQRLHLDRGASAILELFETALHPTTIEPMIDPISLDRLFLFQFDDHAPFAVRLSVMETFQAQMRYAQFCARSMN
jgi:hypothetical protein